MTVNAPFYTDVLIIGAGPGGLMAAHALAKLGIGVKIIDRRGPNDNYGLFDRIASRACPVHVMDMNKVVTAYLALSLPQMSWSLLVINTTSGVAPEIIEEVLRRSMEETGHRVSQRLSPAYIDRAVCRDEPIKVILRRLSLESNINGEVKSVLSNGHREFGPDTDDSEIIFARYVIGADGAHSWVRRHFDIPMEGDQTEYFWGAADVAVTTTFPDYRAKCVIQAATGAVILIPREDDKIRIYVQFDPSEAARDESGRISIPFDAATSMVLDKAKIGLRPYEISFTHVFWCTVFTVSQMVAAKYSVDNRIFILGDACHTHSPKAGQGANAAIGDAHNLAWKIAHVLRGWAKSSLLDTYEIERRRYAQDLIAFDKIIAEALDGGTAADYQSLLHQQNMFTSGIGIRYSSSLIIDAGLPKGAAHLEAGYRLPPVGLNRLADWRPQELQDLAPSDGTFKLFLFPGNILCESDASRLELFCAALSSSSAATEWLGTRVRIYTILDSEKEKAMWNNVPLILRDWKRVFVAASPENAYTKFGISREGAVVLVRPDGHVSLASMLSTSAAAEIMTFFENI
ncbi:Phenol 2-monooxygenase [Mycena venus]|uniref:Phenol 2-monooxygenase n=1 Tax=Mycena venus TaxID=2733690 RepID=A0A8H7C9D9_9AGAR|nr:Phenol 2-monooxygenase [Mycena venus]